MAVLNAVKAQVRQEVAFAVRTAKAEAMTTRGMRQEGRQLAVEAYKTHFGSGGRDNR